MNGSARPAYKHYLLYLPPFDLTDSLETRQQTLLLFVCYRRRLAPDKALSGSLSLSLCAVAALDPPLWTVPNDKALSLSPRARECVCWLFILRTPSRVPDGTPSAYANRADHPDPPPVVPDPESIDVQAAYRGRHNTHSLSFSLSHC